MDNEKSLPVVPPDDKGRFAPVKDDITGEITWATILTPEEVVDLEKTGQKSPIKLPISANPPSIPSKN